MPTRFIEEEDLSPEQTWQPAEWCVVHGAEEFSVTLMGLGGYQDPFNDRFLAAIQRYRIADAQRPHVTTYVGDDDMRPAQLWRGNILLGIVSHESEGFLDLTAVEAAEVAALGIPTRDRGRWV